uniref:Uncharacterized protein n=1 Tax=Tanacetum cinerariifolium TaxID=118510 RepID=A0A6L2L9D6_TANCI|nr:hypothetical protein [Tanacetum cinerariifolium]
MQPLLLRFETLHFRFCHAHDLCHEKLVFGPNFGSSGDLEINKNLSPGTIEQAVLEDWFTRSTSSAFVHRFYKLCCFTPKLDSFLRGTSRGSTPTIMDAMTVYWEIGKTDQGLSTSHT